jgi:DNA-directed RNA polymerase specialized sigma24 family protein
MNVFDLNATAVRADRDRSKIRTRLDPKTLEDRLARCRHMLHFLAVRILSSEGEAEQAVRNSRAAASRNPPSFESEGAFRSWLARILIDEACALRRQK